MSTSWFRRYNKDKEDEDVLDDFDDHFEADSNYDGDADINMDAISTGLVDDDESIHQREVVHTETVEEKLAQKLAFQQGNSADPSPRRLARLKSRAKQQIYPIAASHLDANDASVPSNPLREPKCMTKPVVLHGRLVERAQLDYFIEQDRSGRTNDSKDISADNASSLPQIRDAMERRSVFYRLTSDTARLRSFVNALDDVLRQTKQFQMTHSLVSSSMSSLSPSSVSVTSKSMEEPPRQSHPQTFRLVNVPRLLSAVPESEDQSVADTRLDVLFSLEHNAPDTDPDVLRQLHHRNAQHVNIAAWRVQNLVTQAKALDARIWTSLYDYEKTLRGDTLQQRHQQAACLKLHKDYRRVHRALKLCLSRLSDDISLPEEHRLGNGSLSYAGSPAINPAQRRVEETQFLTGSPLSKVGWIGPKPKEASSGPSVVPEDHDCRVPLKYRAPIHLDPLAPRVIATRSIPRKQTEPAGVCEQREYREDYDPTPNEASKPAPFSISFIAGEMESLVANWKEDDTLTMYTLYEQNKGHWKKHIPWYLACCGPVVADDHRDDTHDDMYAYDLDEGHKDYDTDVRDTPLRWSRRYNPRQRWHKISLPKQPREASF